MINVFMVLKYMYKYYFVYLGKTIGSQTCNQGVVSSNPTGGTNKIKGLAEMLAPCCFCLVSQW
jgi:hypothetical protein